MASTMTWPLTGNGLSPSHAHLSTSPPWGVTRVPSSFHAPLCHLVKAICFLSAAGNYCLFLLLMSIFNSKITVLVELEVTLLTIRRSSDRQSRYLRLSLRSTYSYDNAHTLAYPTLPTGTLVATVSETGINTQTNSLIARLRNTTSISFDVYESANCYNYTQKCVKWWGEAGAVWFAVLV